MATLSEQMAAWLRRQVMDAGARGLVVGLSGGVDSAVVARVSQMAMGDSVIAVILPAHSDPQDERDARLVADQFKLRSLAVDLGNAYDAIVLAAQGAIEASGSVAGAFNDRAHRLSLANVKPRLRMTALYFVANRFNYLLAGTGNRSEIAIGYYTKYGDGGVDLLPLGSLVKGQVFALARELGVPERIVDKPPSAGLWMGQTDEGEMGFSYAELETFLRDGGRAMPAALVAKIERLVRVSEHKRGLPPVFEPA